MEHQYKYISKFSNLTPEERDRAYKNTRNECMKKWYNRQSQEKKDTLSQYSKKLHYGVCSICNNTQYANIYNHYRTKKHLEKANSENETKLSISHMVSCN